MTADIVPEIIQPDPLLPEETQSHSLTKPTPRNKYMLSLPLNNISTSSASRPKLRSFRSSDTSRFPTLEKLENTILPSKNSKITVEPVIFSAESNNTVNAISNGKKLGSQSDARSIHSVKSTKKKLRSKKHQSTPSEIFAKNLSEAVLDVDDSLDDGYVYNNNATYNLYPSLLSPPVLSPYDASTNYKSGNDENYFTNHHHQKYRRPALRSTVSELPARGVKSFYPDCMMMPPKFEKRGSYTNKGQYYSRLRYSSSGEEDEENAPLLYYSSLPRKRSRSFNTKSRDSRRMNSTLCRWMAAGFLFFTILLCSLVLTLASPLQEIEVSYISNVLGTRKQLILNLHIQAANPNSWSVQISHSAFSVFAASRYVPTTHANKNRTSILVGNVNEDEVLPTAKQVEYLGTVNHLDDPLLFSPASKFHWRPKLSNSTSQVQIQNPGATKGDTAGNEKWSSIIRYPYELTIRGVLRYQILPSTFSSTVYSARICKVVQVDPSSGAVEDVPLYERSVCEDW